MDLAGFAHKLFDPSGLIGALMVGGLLILAGIVLSRALHRVLAEVVSHDRSERIDQITLSFLSHLAILLAWAIMLYFAK